MDAVRNDAEDLPALVPPVPYWAGAIIGIVSMALERAEMRALLSADAAYIETFGKSAFERMKTGNPEWVRFFEDALDKIAEGE